MNYFIMNYFIQYLKPNFNPQYNPNPTISVLFDYLDNHGKTKLLKEQGFNISNDMLDAYTVLRDGQKVGETYCPKTSISIGANIRYTTHRLILNFPGLRAYKINAHLNDIAITKIDSNYIVNSRKYTVTEATNSISGGVAYTN